MVLAKRALAAVGATVIHKGRAVEADGLVQNGFDLPQQSIRHAAFEFIGTSLWMDPGGVQRFVAVDIADPGDDSLVEQQGLDLPPPTEQLPKHRRRRVERLDAQWSKPPADVRLVTGQTPHPAEATRITKPQLATSPPNRNAQVRVRLRQHIPIDDGKPAAHTQVKNQLGGRFEGEDDPFRSSRDVDHAPPRQQRGQRAWVAVNNVGPNMKDRSERSTYKQRPKITDNGLDLG